MTSLNLATPGIPVARSEDTEYLLIVDDEPLLRDSLARGLWQAGYQCATAASGDEALARLRQGRYAVMLCDVRMPGMDGITLVPQALRRDPDMVIVMVTALAGLQTALDAIRAGAYDYITKPFQLREIDLLVQRALAHRRLRLENKRYVSHLEELVEERTRHVRRIAVDVITSLGLALEAKDQWTHDHSRRVAELAWHLAARLKLEKEARDDVRLAGLLHDIGKIGVREEVLHKPAALSTDEYQHIQLHPVLGARILEPLEDLRRVVPYVRHHHERWDGGGYPDRLRGEEIPFGARVLAVADAYTAMCEKRPYRDPMHRERALTEIRLGARRQFDLHVIGALLDLRTDGTLDSLAPFSEVAQDAGPE